MKTFYKCFHSPVIHFKTEKNLKKTGVYGRTVQWFVMGKVE